MTVEALILKQLNCHHTANRIQSTLDHHFVPRCPTMTQPTNFRIAKRYTLWLLATVFFALSYFAAGDLLQKIQERNDARRILAWTKTGIVLEQLIHELQKERGLSSGLLGTHGERFGETLGAQRMQTDRAIAQAGAAAADHQAPTIAGAPLLLDRERLAGLRAMISELRLSRDAVVDRYTAQIDILFEHLLSTMNAGPIGWIYRKQMALIFFLQAREMAALERALLTEILSANDFSPVRMAGFHRIRTAEELRIEKFIQLSEKPVRADYQKLASQPFVREANRILALVNAVGASQTRPHTPLLSAEKWFALSTQKIDALSQFEDVLTEELLNNARTLEEAAQREFIVSALTVLLSFMLGLGLLLHIWRGKRMAEKNLYLAAAAFKNSIDSIVITDAEARIVEVNRAFTQITGYEREEVVGQHSRMLKSGRHERGYYEKMWEQLLRTGRWDGEIWNRRKNGSIYPALLSIVEVKNSKGRTENFIATTVDLGKHKEIEAQLDQLRTFDPLTGLPNGDAWVSALDQAIADAESDRRSFAILEIGLDRFKLINDSLSHAIGDKVLIKVAERLKKCLDRHDMLARHGGDRLSILLPDVADAQSASACCEKLLAAFTQPVAIGGHTLSVSASIGAAFYPGDGGDAKTLRKNVESAMYGAKDDGRGGYRFYSAEMNALGLQMLNLESMLRVALEQNELSLYYQPQVLAADGRLTGVEALLRWKNPELGMISPVQFIPIAEETGLIVPIGEWVMREACRQAKAWNETLGIDLPVAVNLSARQFRNKNLGAVVRDALETSGLPGRLLELEITEGLLMNDPAGSKTILESFRDIGVRISLDDFGTGYSSLAYLKNFPINCLKIDRAFVKDLPDNNDDKAITRAIIALGKNLGMHVLAEGVETRAQGKFLAAEGCDIFQGFFYGKPMPGAELTEKILSGLYLGLSENTVAEG